MLRRCRLCARQLQSSRSLALSARHRPKGDDNSHHQHHELDQQQPVASTSKHVFEPAWTSTLPRCLQRSRNHSTSATATLPAQEAAENRFEHDFKASNSSNKILLENKNKRAGNPESTTSLWKGKARAIEDDTLQSVPWQASTEADLLEADSASADQQQPIISNALSPEAVSIAEVQDSIEYFETLIQQGDYIACFLAVVQDCLHSSQTSRPHAKEEIRHRIHRMHETFSDKPRTRSLCLLTAEGSALDDKTFNVETVVPLLFKAVLEQDAYRSWRVRLQQLLKRVVPYLLAESFENANSCLTAVMSQFSTRRRWESIEQIGRLARESFGRWTRSTLPLYLEAIDKLDRHYLAPQIESFPPDMLPFTLESRIYDYLLKCHLSNRNLSAAKAVLDSMTAAGIIPNRYTFEFVYAGYRPLGGYSTFLDDAKQLNLASSRRLVNLVLDDLIKDEGLLAGIEAVEALPRIAAEKVQLAIASSNNDNQRETTSNSLVDQNTPSTTSDASIVPLQEGRDRSTFGLMVRAYATVGDFDRALDTYVEMIEEGIQPSAFTQAALVAAYRIPQESDPAGFQATNQTLPIIPANLVADQRTRVFRAQLPIILDTEGLHGALEEIEEMNNSGTRLDDRSISIIFNYLAKSGLASASTLSQLLPNLRRAHGSSYRVTDVNILIQELITAEENFESEATSRPLEIAFTPNPAIDEDVAFRFHDILAQLSLQGSKPDDYTMMLVMKRYADNGGSPRKLWEFFRTQFLDQGFKPNAHHIGALMIAFINAGDVFGARRVLDRGSALGVKPTIHHLTILLNFFVKARHAASARVVLREIEERELQTDIYVLAAKAELESHYGNIAGVKALESEARSRFPKEKWPNPAFETIKIQCRLQLRRPLEALRALKPVLSLKLLVPDKQLHRTILSVDRAARNSLNQTEEGTRAHEEAKALASVAAEVKRLSITSRRNDSREAQKKFRAEIKQLLGLINANREIAGDYDVEQYTMEDSTKTIE